MCGGEKVSFELIIWRSDYFFTASFAVYDGEPKKKKIILSNFSLLLRMTHTHTHKQKGTKRFEPNSQRTNERQSKPTNANHFSSPKKF